MGKKDKKRILNSYDEGISEDEGLAVKTVVESIKKALSEAQEKLKYSGIKLKRIELTLKSIASEKAGVGITFQIPILGELKIGSDVSSKSVQTIFLALKTPKPPTKERTPPRELDKNLENLISGLAEGVKTAVDGEMPLEMDESWVELNFVLQSENEISLIIEAGFDAELTNNLKIIFEKM